MPTATVEVNGARAGARTGATTGPRKVARRAARLGGELARIAAGRSSQAPPSGDRRFADPAWERNWLLHRVMGAYLAVGESVDGVISDAELGWQTERQARFAASNVLDALAPANLPWSNPAVLRAVVDEGGANLVRGSGELVPAPKRLGGRGHRALGEAPGTYALAS
jgi:polyhydroxyalkanoate synthase